jgi:radical SAM superfamily enzyme YgiQ (UPF0313 family)
MRIALIYPATDFDRRYHAEALPIGLLYLAACVEQRRGAVVDLYDARHGPALPDPARIHEYDLVGFSAMTTQISRALALTTQLRQAGYRGPIAFGGPHASVAPDHLKSQPGIDAVFIGEAEETFPAYLDYLEGRPHELARVWLRDASSEWQYHAGERFVQDLDSLPFPAREKCGDLTARTKFINLTTTRGCPFQCNYCQPTKEILFGRKVRRRSVDNIVAEIDDAVRRFAITRFAVDDDTFTYHEPTVLEFCDRIRPTGLLWSCQSRSDISLPTLERMRDSGCEALFVGAESGSRRILDRMGKRNTPEANARFIRACNALGIRTWCNMMVGYPGETREDLEQSLRFVRETRPSRVCVSQVTPFPGTYLWRQHERDVIDQDWDSVARHIFLPKFRSMARRQRLLDYYRVMMSREWNEPFGFEQFEDSSAPARWIGRSPFLVSWLSRRLPSGLWRLTRRGRRYPILLAEALDEVRAGRTEEGIRRLERLRRRYPRKTDPLGHLGWIYLTTGRPAKAIENYERLLALDPTNGEARALLEKARRAAAESQCPGAAPVAHS